MKIIEGDLLTLANDGKFDVIVHGCNCFCKMGNGIAKQIKDRYPAAYLVDMNTSKGDRSKLGTFTSATINGLTIINAYTQYGYGRDKQHVDYTAIRDVFNHISTHFKDKRIGYPKIGAGLAGGDWDIIAPIIDTALVGMDHTLVIKP